ncbi:FadR family transcriptional regulator [Evansella sp. LMS18]|uniref:FadR/GntR family transcriptional regulator n=1 Tax=Evansella sp. LMS18 TaxID=2924033 RepID=UPI0020D0C85B|nr:FadR/GntR family transcriptional regulator [Evansella sp. LMS18]UTR11927.1 FadR family transcriptional regulator [Evansella sp. LMS18]
MKPIKKRRLFEEVILAIEDYIAENNIKPGEKLPSENELAAIFKVSKTAIREALSVLQANNITETRSGSGTYLRDIQGDTIGERVTRNLMDKDKLREILEFRRGIEIEAVALAAVRATEKQLDAVKKAHLALIEANEAKTIGVKEDYEFHYSIILAAQNSIYTEVFEKVSNQFEEGLRISKMQSARNPELFIMGNQEHEQILEALYDRNPEKASAVMRRHLIRNEEKIWGKY